MKSFCAVGAVCILLANVVFVFADGSNLQMDITQNGINYANQVALDKLKESLQTLGSFDDQSGQSGSLSWTVSNIKNSLILGLYSNLVLSPDDNGLILILSNFGALLHADFYTSFCLWVTVLTSGSIDVTISDVSVYVPIRFGVRNGRPTLIAGACNSRIGGIDLNINVDLYSSIVNFFKDIIKDTFRDKIQSAICDFVRVAINGPANEEISSMTVDDDIGGIFGLDYSLSSAPNITSNFLTFNHLGNIYSLNNGYFPSSYCTPTDFPPLTTYDKMLYISISECMANDLAYIAYDNDYLVYKTSFNDNDIANTYTNVELSVRTSEPPTVRFTENEITVFVTVDATVAGIPDLPSVSGDGPIYGPFDPSSVSGYSPIVDIFQVPIVSLGLRANLTIQPQIASGKVVANVADYSFDFDIYYSVFEDLDYDGLRAQVATVIETQIIPQLDALGAVGIDLPVTSSLHLIDPALNVHDGYVRIETDVEV